MVSKILLRVAPLGQGGSERLRSSLRQGGSQRVEGVVQEGRTEEGEEERAKRMTGSGINVMGDPTKTTGNKREVSSARSSNRCRDRGCRQSLRNSGSTFGRDAG